MVHSTFAPMDVSKRIVMVTMRVIMQVTMMRMVMATVVVPARAGVILRSHALRRQGKQQF